MCDSNENICHGALRCVSFHRDKNQVSSQTLPQLELPLTGRPGCHSLLWAVTRDETRCAALRKALPGSFRKTIK